MPTLAEASGAKIPDGLDGVSFLPTLLGGGKQAQHEFLYWEYTGQVAVRKGDWKLYKTNKSDWQLYDLAEDSLEEIDLSKKHPEKLKELIAHAEASHTPATPGAWIDPSQKFTRPSQPKKKVNPKR